MLTLDKILELLSLTFQVIGMIAFGVTAGWLTLSAFQKEDEGWQLRGVMYGVFFAFAAYITRTTGPGGVGGFLLGASAAFVIWGLLKDKNQAE